MGFYYGSSQPPDDEPPGGFKETVAIILAVFQVLAVPLGILFGGLFGLAGLFYLFSVSKLAGLAVLALIVIGLVARGVWEARHPPDLS